MRAAKPRRFRDLSLGLAALVGALLTLVAIVWVNIDFLEAADRNDTETREELAVCATVQDAVSDQANALGGLISTRDPRYIEPYDEGRDRLNGALIQITAFAADDPPAQRLDAASAVAAAKQWTLSFAQPWVDSVRLGHSFPSDAARDTAKKEVAEIHQAIDNLQASESRQLHLRDQAQAAAYRTSRIALLLGSAAALAFAILILGRSARQLITERRLAEETAARLAQALDQAQAGERTKTRFLANMSHEMRTPLNGVGGMTEALAHTNLDPLQRELVEAIQFSSITLDQLIGDLLSLSGDSPVERAAPALASFRLGSAVRAAAKPFEAEARDKGLGFAIEIGDCNDAMVLGDAQRLGQVLACLLSNAVKFTDQGQVRLNVQALSEGHFAFEVADSGVGFDGARKAQLFETFSQSDDSDTRRHGGAGLGLALANRLTEELGGMLEAHSSPGAGSIFRFEIELAAADDLTTEPSANLTAAHEAGAEPGDDPFRVLIVDDNPTNRKVLELILEQLGAQWVSVEDGLQAVQAASQQAFTAILMDIQMPVMDGLTATREIRRLEREANRAAAPIIIVSASCQPEHIAAGKAAGAQQHLGKPVSAQALVDALNAVLADEAQAA
jgi:signal transduction histidine kinase/ActR/RegA family two-component response regulator